MIKHIRMCTLPSKYYHIMISELNHQPTPNALCTIFMAYDDEIDDSGKTICHAFKQWFIRPEDVTNGKNAFDVAIERVEAYLLERDGTPVTSLLKL